LRQKKNMIFNKDDYTIFDKLMKQSTKCPIGWVKIFSSELNLRLNKPDWSGSNLVVGRGREFVAQKCFQKNVYDGGVRADWRSYVISHFGVGSGGSIVNGEDVTLNGPYICDTSLIIPISLGNVAYLNDPSGYSSGDNIHEYTKAVKPIETGGSIYMESKDYTGGGVDCVYYTKVKCTCVIDENEPSSLESGESVKLDEASLYFVNGNNVETFAHICFPPKWKEKESKQIIVWYILF